MSKERELAERASKIWNVPGYLSARVSPVVLGILVAENRFRPLSHRLFEALAVILHRNPHSIGIAQLPVTFWKQYLGTNKLGIVTLLRIITDVELNAFCLQAFLKQLPKDGGARTVSGAYTGSFNRCYEAILKEVALEQVKMQTLRQAAQQRRS